MSPPAVKEHQLMRGVSIYDSAHAYQASIPLDLRNKPGLTFVPRASDRPNVLVVGDSISIGYTVALRQALADIAAVLRVPDNASSTRYAQAHIERWLDDRDWDVIQVNWGLHDLRVDSTTGQVATSPNAYRHNVESLLDQISRRTTRLVIATSTPIPNGAAGRVAGSEVPYNEIFIEIAAARGLAVIDLWGAVTASRAPLQLEANVHFSEGGYRFLGEVVAENLRRIVTI